MECVECGEKIEVTANPIKPEAELVMHEKADQLCEDCKENQDVVYFGETEQ